MEGLVLLAILVILAFLFAFFGVIALLVRTGNQSSQIAQNSKLLFEAQQKLESLQKTINDLNAGIYPPPDLSPTAEAKESRPATPTVPTTVPTVEDKAVASAFRATQTVYPLDMAALPSEPAAAQPPARAETAERPALASQPATPLSALAASRAGRESLLDKFKKNAQSPQATSLSRTLLSFISGGHLWVAGGVALLFVAFVLLLHLHDRPGHVHH